MNIFVQYCSLALLFLLLGDGMENGEAYKVIRPYKYYHRRPLHRSRWHGGSRSPKSYRSKRIPKDYPYRRPSRYRYRPLNDDVDQSGEDQPYTIVIQLPKRNDNHNRHLYQRNYESGSTPLRERGVDYIEDEQDVDARMLNVDNKKVRIKVTKGESPKLHIKISRIDTENDIEIIDKMNVTAMDIPLQKMYTNLTLSVQPSDSSDPPNMADSERK